jgi:hypothetical protein
MRLGGELVVVGRRVFERPLHELEVLARFLRRLDRAEHGTPRHSRSAVDQAE